MINLHCSYFWKWHDRESIKVAAAGDFDNNAPNLQIFSLAEIEAATDRFSVENKLGEGGYGPVFKVNSIRCCLSQLKNWKRTCNLEMVTIGDIY